MNKELGIVTENRLRITFSNYGTWISIKSCYPYEEGKEIICFYEGMTLLRKKRFSPVFLIKYKRK